MAQEIHPNLGINSWLEDELYQQYLHDHQAVGEDWKQVFETLQPAPSAPTGNGKQPFAAAPPAPEPAGGAELVPLRGAAARIAGNMNASLSIPLATSQRTIPVKVIDENRGIINQHRTLLGKSKISYTHLIGWAIVRALDGNPAINHAYLERGGQSFRVVNTKVNLGVAVDVAGKDGARSLMVPNIKDAGSKTFSDYVAAFDDIVARARSGKLGVADFQGTTISLTNPGSIGTVGSVPRLMPGQGAIIATGAIDYPAEFEGVAPSVRSALGIGKVMTVTCTYDHRVIQGAESGAFLGKLQALLQGEDKFYENIFADLKMPHQPVRWEPDQQPSLPGTGLGAPSAVTIKEAAVLQLINAYRVRGHLIADLDPLGSEPSYHPELDPATYGLTIWDLDRQFLTGTLGEAIGEGAPQPVATLREILHTLRQTYCGKIGCEYMNIQHPEQKQWLQRHMEPRANQWPIETEARLRILTRLVEAEEFEHFLHARYVGHKRFSLEGAESAIPILDEIMNRACDNSVREVVMGMAHRGRLNILANLVGKPLPQIFSEFEGAIDPQSIQGSGDVKYHLGATGTHQSPSGRSIAVSLSPNPSHLEAVDPVVEGIARAKQDRTADIERSNLIPILIHGDAAFAGQGVVAETLNLSQLEGYHTGGTIHLVINNQIGFTTRPDEARSTPYSTDVARMVQAPIFHVNGDDPEACIRAAELAFDFRNAFKKDVVIDMFCYRKHGHNEADDPSYTAPILYRKIRRHPPVSQLYAERLKREKAAGEEAIHAIRARITEKLREGFEAAQRSAERYELQELAIVDTEAYRPVTPRTAVSHEVIERVIHGLTLFPQDFRLHPKLRGFIDRRRQFLDGAPGDWALGEALAFGSLVLENTPVRLSGQDSGRGTFSQRHLEFYDSEDGRLYIPLRHLDPKQAPFDVWDSSLSEYAVMGFEFGYSLGDPSTLGMWEAQFGDFANGAQIMIDQFISSSEAKWGQPSGIVLLLPHGYEGQGPEHSSARIERFLQLAAEGNIQVANCTTPAQYFHLLRRQMHGGHDRRGMRKPLVIFTPKSILRHPKAVSALPEFTAGSFFEVLPDTTVASPDRVSRVILCSGKVYYDLLAAREEHGGEEVAIVRMEQLYPFPRTELEDVLARYPATAELVWVQEEPQNMGAWWFVERRMTAMLDSPKRTIRYVGRAESSSPSAGSLKRHQQEQAGILQDAFAQGGAERARPVRLVPRRKAR